MYALRYPVLIQPGTIWCPQVPVTHNISKLSRARLQAESHAEAGLAPAWGPAAQQHQDSLPFGQLGTREDYIRSGFGGGTGSTVQWQMLPWGCVTDLPAQNQTPRHEDMLQRATTRPAGATTCCGMGLPSSVPPPIWSHRIAPSALLFSFVSPHKCLSGFCSTHYSFFLERSGGPSTRLPSEKKN